MKNEKSQLWDSYEKKIKLLNKLNLSKKERKLQRIELMNEYKEVRDYLGLTNQTSKENKTKKLKNNPTWLKEYSTENRNNPTDAEQSFYFTLVSNGIQFETQKAISVKKGKEGKFYYILDFFIPTKKIAIEVDGGYHSNTDQKQKDQLRDSTIAKLGIETIRLTNEEVLTCSDKLIKIIKYLKS